MRYTPLERDIHTLYVPEDYIDRLAEHAAAGDLLSANAQPVCAHVTRCSGNHLQLHVPDPDAARRLQFNVLDVWRVDSQTIHYRVRYRPDRRERVRELWRSAPPPPACAVMVPVIAVLAFIVPEVLLMPVFGLASAGRAIPPATRPLGKALKAVADGALT